LFTIIVSFYGVYSELLPLIVSASVFIWIGKEATEGYRGEKPVTPNP